MSGLAARAYEQARHDADQARLSGARALNLSPRRIVDSDGIVYPGNAIYRHLERMPEGFAALDTVQRLDLAGSRVARLDSVLELPRLEVVHFRGIPACAADPALPPIAEIENETERLTALRRHLTAREAAAEPALEPPAPAPVMVAFEGDRLTASPASGATRDAAAARRAQDAWAALRAFHDDVAGLLAGRNLGHLDRALGAFGRALGTTFETMNVFGLGTHGRRIARIAAEADEVLLDEAAADLREFAAAIVLYLDRFTDWRAYLADAEATAADATPIRSETAAIAEALTRETWVDAEVPGQLAETAEGTMSGDPVASRGLIASLANVIGAVGQRVLSGLRAVRRETGRVLSDIASEFRKSIAKRTAQALTVALLGFLAAQAMRLEAIARALPAQLGWISDFLRQLGLL